MIDSSRHSDLGTYPSTSALQGPRGRSLKGFFAWLAVGAVLSIGFSRGGTPAQASPPLSLAREGRLLVHGKPELLFGLYHVSWMPWLSGKPRLGPELIEDVATMGALGLNSGQINFEPGIIGLSSLQRAAKFKMLLFGELQYGWWNAGRAQDNAFAAIDRVTSNEWLGAWNICDDINWKDPKRSLPIEPEALRARSQLIKSRAPQQLTYASGVALDTAHDTYIRPMRDYRHTADILGFTSYTLGRGSGIPEDDALEQNVRNFRALEEAFAGTDQPLIAIPQLFRFPEGPEPSIQEVRNWVYVALMHGADGIFGYGFYTKENSVGVFLPETNPTLLKDVATLAREVLSAKSWLLAGERSHIAMNQPWVHATRWHHRDSDYLVVVSTNRSQPLTATIRGSGNGHTLHELLPDPTEGLLEQDEAIQASDKGDWAIPLTPGQVRVFHDKPLTAIP